MDQARGFLFARSQPSKDAVDFYGVEPSDNNFSLSTSAVDDYCVVQPPPCQRGAMPSLESFTPEKPLIVTGDPRAVNQVVGADHRGHVPYNVTVPIETDTFVGRIRNVVKGYPGTPEAEFKGSKLLAKVIIQGMFKSRTAAKDMWVGQELPSKILLPVSFQRLVFTSAAKMFSNTYRVKVEGESDTIGYLNPLLAVSTILNVSRPGEQPDMWHVPEDARLLDSSLQDRWGEPWSSTQRQRYYDKLSNLERVEFGTEHVYTFVICQSIMDLLTYRLKLGALFNLDLCPVLNGQPLQMMCKNIKSNEVVLSLLVWHKQLNYPAGCLPSRPASYASSTTSSYRHTRDHSRDTICSTYSSSSSSTYSSSSSSGASCMSSSSSGSVCGLAVESSASSSSAGSVSLTADDSSSGSSGASCADDSSSDAGSEDFHSCVSEESEDCEIESEAGVHASQLQQQGDRMEQQQQREQLVAASEDGWLLETAQSAPANLALFAADSSCDAPPSPVRVTVIPSCGTLGADAEGAARGLRPRSSSNSGAKAEGRGRKGRAAAAIASAARRVASRLKSCSGNRL